jgi:PII-like signaling protein
MSGLCSSLEKRGNFSAKMSARIVEWRFAMPKRITPNLSPGEKPPIPKPGDLPEECTLLRIFLGEGDEYQDRPLYRKIVLKAREFHLAGATVLRGPMGFGRSAHLHNANILRLSLDLPIIVEIVEETSKIEAFLPELEKMMEGGLITLEKAQVFRYR